MKTKNITLKWLYQNNACSSGKKWFIAQDKKNEVDVINALIKDGHYGWASWIVVRRLTLQNRIRYAIYAATQVLSLYEDKYPDDKRPRKAILAAKAYLKSPSAINKKTAAYAANAAYAAADAAADAAAYAASYAAYAAADAAAYAAADAAADAAYAAMKTKILKYGVKLLKK